MSVEQNLQEIEGMTRVEMARLMRFAPSGHPFFITGSEEWEKFSKRFASLGGMSTEISKEIGWERG